MSIFSTLRVYHDIDSRSAALNMAIDEALLESAIAPTIRFYRWNHPALSFGYFGRCADVSDEDRDVVRRWTGGGIVFHGNDLTYSLVIPANDSAFEQSPTAIYENVHAAICTALKTTGCFAELWGAHAPRVRISAPSPKSPLKFATARPRSPAREGACAPQKCFENPVRADVLIDGRKVAGAAQRRTRRGLLQQGSVQSVNLAGDFEFDFVRALSAVWAEQKIDEHILDRAEEIAAQKYATEAWLRKR